MFVIPNIMVEDKKLAEVLRALAGKVLQMEPPRPVVVDEPKANGHAAPKLVDFIMAMPKEFKVEELRDKMVASGVKYRSAPGNALTAAKKLKLVKRAGFGRWRRV